MDSERPRIVVGVDGSPGATAAAAWALDLAVAMGADVEFVSCARPLIPAEVLELEPSGFLPEAEAALAATMVKVGDALRRARTAGLDVSTRALEGTAGPTLVREA